MLTDEKNPNTTEITTTTTTTTELCRRDADRLAKISMRHHKYLTVMIIFIIVVVVAVAVIFISNLPVNEADMLEPLVRSCGGDVPASATLLVHNSQTFSVLVFVSLCVQIYVILLRRVKMFSVEH